MRGKRRRAIYTRPNRSPSSGLGVDASGGSVIDPTANVTMAMEAAADRIDDLQERDVRRQDDLRDAESRLMFGEFRRIDDLRAAEVRRQDDLRAAESRRQDEQAAMSDLFGEQLRLAEAKRIDAIRAVDVNAVAVERQRSSDQASVLASQVAQSADTLRSLVATTAQAVATLQAAFDVRLKLVEQTQYEGKGKAAVSDPEIVRLSADIRELLKARDDSGGDRRGRTEQSASIRNAITIVAVLISLLVGSLVTPLLNNRSAAAPASPQVIYLPAGATIGAPLK